MTMNTIVWLVAASSHVRHNNVSIDNKSGHSWRPIRHVFGGITPARKRQSASLLSVSLSAARRDHATMFKWFLIVLFEGISPGRAQCWADRRLRGGDTLAEISDWSYPRHHTSTPAQSCHYTITVIHPSCASPCQQKYFWRHQNKSPVT